MLPTILTILIILLVILISGLVVYACLTSPGRRRPISPELLGAQYAHRGLHNAERAENSISAFRRAVELGFEGFFQGKESASDTYTPDFKKGGILQTIFE